MTSDGATTRVVLWFRNDLRLSDNYMVKQAESMAKRTQRCDVLPVYCFDPRTFAPSAWGSPKTGGHRARFQLECVMNLKVRRCFSWLFFLGGVGRRGFRWRDRLRCNRRRDDYPVVFSLSFPQLNDRIYSGIVSMYSLVFIIIVTRVSLYESTHHHHCA